MGFWKWVWGMVERVPEVSSLIVASPLVELIGGVLFTIALVFTPHASWSTHALWEKVVWNLLAIPACLVALHGSYRMKDFK